MKRKNKIKSTIVLSLAVLAGSCASTPGAKFEMAQKSANPAEKPQLVKEGKKVTDKGTNDIQVYKLGGDLQVREKIRSGGFVLNMPINYIQTEKQVCTDANYVAVDCGTLKKDPNLAEFITW